VRGSASSANNFMFSLGFVLGPSVAGAVIADIGHHSVFVVIGFVGIAGTLFVHRTLRRLEGVRAETAAPGIGTVLEHPAEPPS
jgi:MFS family permease